MDVNTWRSSKARYIINGFSGFFSSCCLWIETIDNIWLALWWWRKPALGVTTEKESLLQANMLRENVGHPINKQVWGVVPNCTQRSGVLDSGREKDENPHLKKNLVMEVVAKGGVGRSKISGSDVSLVITTRWPRTIVRLETTPGKNQNCSTMLTSILKKKTAMPTW